MKDKIPEFEMHPFLLVADKAQLASFLGTTVRRLNYIAYVVSPASKYVKFQISKRNGGKRTIHAPIKLLKELQRRLASTLNEIYAPKVCNHGYVRGRSILSNARVHHKQRWVMRVDLEDFFGTINFGRVRGLFLKHPFKFDEEVATILAQLCCYDNALPQGAPTSPIISNMICQSLDRQMNIVAKNFRCYYSRYADDLTFSTSLKKFPEQLCSCSPDEEGKLVPNLGANLKDTISKQGFKVNESKTRLSGQEARQVVTGLVVNDKVNVRRDYIRGLRTVLYSWKSFGVEEAASHFFQNYDLKNRTNEPDANSFIQVVRGKVPLLSHKLIQ